MSVPPSTPAQSLTPVPQAACELVIGGQKSGKSRLAEARTQAWLKANPTHTAMLLATAVAHDDEMRLRIARHRADRAALPRPVAVVETSRGLAQALRQHSAPGCLLVVDCLTLWLTDWLMPADPSVAATPEQAQAAVDALLDAVQQSAGPVVLVSNEIGLGVVPMGVQVRAMVDALGQLNQRVALIADRVTWMVAGVPVAVKGGA